MPEREILSVAELTRRVKALVEGDFLPIWVQGEIANFTLHSSGHLYFTLRDATAQLRCVMFRRYRPGLRLKPADGMEVVARGRLTVYERGGNYQLVVEIMQPVGVGELELALAALKEKLAAEGLFDPARKRELPAFPGRIGVVTSPTGAAIRDILRVLRRRAPALPVVLAPARVQGEGAAEEIAGALVAMGRWGGVELIIVGRGGGSAEDLAAFNHEAVVRAVAASPVPVISAVGHETDVTLCDLASDVRAPTPSAAAEMAAPDVRELRAAVADLGERLRPGLVRHVARSRERLRALLARYGWKRLPGLVREWAQRRDELEERLGRAFVSWRGREANRLEALEAKLLALDPGAVLGRGYAVARRAADGRTVREAAGLSAGESLVIIFHRGRADCRVERVYPDAGGLAGTGR